MINHHLPYIYTYHYIIIYHTYFPYISHIFPIYLPAFTIIYQHFPYIYHIFTIYFPYLPCIFTLFIYFPYISHIFTNINTIIYHPFFQAKKTSTKDPALQHVLDPALLVALLQLHHQLLGASLHQAPAQAIQHQLLSSETWVVSEWLKYVGMGQNPGT